MKKGLKEFQKIYDIECIKRGLFLDLAQNLRFRFEAGNKEITLNDLNLCRAIFERDLMEVIHKLADKLGYTKEDYIENSNKRTGKSNCNVYIAGQGSVNCDVKELLK